MIGIAFFAELTFINAAEFATVRSFKHAPTKRCVRQKDTLAERTALVQKARNRRKNELNHTSSNAMTPMRDQKKCHKGQGLELDLPEKQHDTISSRNLIRAFLGRRNSQ